MSARVDPIDHVFDNVLRAYERADSENRELRRSVRRWRSVALKSFGAASVLLVVAVVGWVRHI